MTNSEYQQLVEFLGQRFVAIDRRFDVVDRRFDALEQRVETGFRDVSGHLEAIYARLERLEQEYHAIVEGLRRIEAMLADESARREMLERGLADLRERVALLQARIDELERRLRA